jgi:hypothetical protein
MTADPYNEGGPATQVVTEMTTLGEQILWRAYPDEPVHEGQSVDWSDPVTGKGYSLRRGFRDITVLEATDGDWDEATLYRAGPGPSDLTIGSNEKPIAGLTFEERFRPIVNAMRDKLASEGSEDIVDN